MSQYNVVIHTDSTKPANETHRLCVCNFKEMPVKDADGNKVKNADGTIKMKPKHANRSVSIPKLAGAAGCVDVIREALQDAFYDLQDAVIKAIIVEALDAGSTGADGKLKQIVITDEQISLDACARFHASTSTGKLSKELLARWFDEALADTLTVKLADIMKLPDAPTAEQTAKLEAGIKQYKDLYASLAAPKAQLPEALAKQLRGALKLATDGRIKNTLAEKLTTMLQPKEITLAIGFTDTEDESSNEESSNTDSTELQDNGTEELQQNAA